MEIVNGEPGEHIKAVKSKFRLIHVQKGKQMRQNDYYAKIGSTLLISDEGAISDWDIVADWQ